jgi:hypothetical protein
MANLPISGFAVPFYIEGMHGWRGGLRRVRGKRVTDGSVTALYLAYGGG